MQLKFLNFSEKVQILVDFLQDDIAKNFKRSQHQETSEQEHPL